MIYRIASLVALLLCCAQCAGVGPPNSQSPATLPNAGRSALGPFLYIGGGKLSQYALGDSNPRHSVDLSLGASALALDSRGDLFVANGGASEGYIAVYDAQSLELRRSEELTDDTFLAVGRRGYLYASNCGGGINVFTPGGIKYDYTHYLRKGAVCALAFDRDDDLFVVDGNSIAVFAPAQPPGNIKLVRKIRSGINEPRALAFASSGEPLRTQLPALSQPSRAPVRQRLRAGQFLAGTHCQRRYIASGGARGRLERHTLCGQRTTGF